jgi:uncharacterized protein YjaZ
MKKYAIIILVCILCPLIIKAQDRVTADPDSANIVTADISNFWQAFDLLQSKKTTEDSLKVIRSVFMDHASEGLKQYLKAASCDEMQYLQTIRKRRSDYLAIRQQSEVIASKKQQLIHYLHRFKQLYPQLKIPAICFTIGKFEVGGTQFENTLFIGCEKDLQLGVDIIAQAIHELAHFQQLTQNTSTNLESAMIEGGAEFICYQVTGKRTIYKTWAYGIANEQSLWNEFKPKQDSATEMKWFLDVAANNRPGSLRYFIGFRICEAYLKNHPDKKLALKDLVEMKNPKKIYLESGYR